MEVDQIMADQESDKQSPPSNPETMKELRTTLPEDARDAYESSPSSHQRRNYTRKRVHRVAETAEPRETNEKAHPGPHPRTRGQTPHSKGPRGKRHAFSPGRNDGSGKSPKANRIPQQCRTSWRIRRLTKARTVSMENKRTTQRGGGTNVMSPNFAQFIGQLDAGPNFFGDSDTKHQKYTQESEAAGEPAWTPVEWTTKKITQRLGELVTKTKARALERMPSRCETTTR